MSSQVFAVVNVPVMNRTGLKPSGCASILVSSRAISQKQFLARIAEILKKLLDPSPVNAYNELYRNVN